MRNISMLAVVLFAITNLFSMDNEEERAIPSALKAFRQGPASMYVSKSKSDGWEVMVLESTETDVTMEIIPFHEISQLVCNAYHGMEASISQAIAPYDKKTKKELLKFYNFMKDKDLPQRQPTIRDITDAVNKVTTNFESNVEKKDNVEKFIKKISSLVDENKSILEYINKAAQDYEGDTDKAWQAAIEQIKKDRAAYRNAYLNNDPNDSMIHWIVHPKSLYYKNKDQAEQN